MATRARRGKWIDNHQLPSRQINCLPPEVSSEASDWRSTSLRAVEAGVDNDEGWWRCLAIMKSIRDGLCLFLLCLVI